MEVGENLHKYWTCPMVESFFCPKILTHLRFVVITGDTGRDARSCLENDSCQHYIVRCRKVFQIQIRMFLQDSK